MRALLVFMIIAGLTGLYVFQKQHEDKTEPVQSGAAKPATAAELTPAPRGQASEHNWMKRALDRAADVRDQARQQTKESQDP